MPCGRPLPPGELVHVHSNRAHPTTAATCTTGAELNRDLSQSNATPCCHPPPPPQKSIRVVETPGRRRPDLRRRSTKSTPPRRARATAKATVHVERGAPAPAQHHAVGEDPHAVHRTLAAHPQVERGDASGVRGLSHRSGVRVRDAPRARVGTERDHRTPREVHHHDARLARIVRPVAHHHRAEQQEVLSATTTTASAHPGSERAGHSITRAGRRGSYAAHDEHTVREVHAASAWVTTSCPARRWAGVSFLEGAGVP